MADEPQSATDDTKPEGTPEAAETGAQDDLESLLAEFEQSDTPEAKPDSTTDDDLKAKVDRLEKKLDDTQNHQALQGVIKNVKGDLDVDEDFVEAWLTMKARKDPRNEEAYVNRHKNPEKFAKLEKAWNKELGQKFPKLDTNVTDDVEAVASAVRGAATKAPADDDIPDVGSMSDTQFEQWAATQKA